MYYWKIFIFSPVPYYWIQSNVGAEIPTSAVQGGFDSDGTSIYVGRSFHEGDWIPAKVIPQKNIAYVAYNGQEIPKEEYEVRFCFFFYFLF